MANKHAAQKNEPILSLVLVFIETLLSWLLKYDANLRQLVHPLSQQNTVLCVRTYLPHRIFYVSFTDKGMLFDTQLPDNKQQEDILLSTYSLQLLNALMSHDHKTISKLQMRGETYLVEQVQNVFLGLGFAQLMQTLLSKLKSLNVGTVADEQKKLMVYKQRINDQQAQINQLTLNYHELKANKQALEQKLRLLWVGMGILTLICVILMVSLLF